MSALLAHIAFGLGGGLGAVARHLLTLAVTHRYPLSTLLVNVLGCLVLGLTAGFLETPGGQAGAEVRQAVAGFCGGFTTFSTYVYQTLDLHRQETLLHAAANVLVSLLACLLALWVGQLAAGAFSG